MKRRTKTARAKPAPRKPCEPPTEAERQVAAIGRATALLAEFGCDKTRNCGCDMCTESRTDRLKPEEPKLKPTQTPPAVKSPQLSLF